MPKKSASARPHALWGWWFLVLCGLPLAARSEDPPPPIGASTPASGSAAPESTSPIPSPANAGIPATDKAAAGETDPRFDAHAQATYIRQYKDAFPAEYSGGKSLSTVHESSFTGSITAFLGARLLPGTELYVDPEIIEGVPLSGLQGLGSFTNGEIQKVAGPKPKLYLPRAFLRQTWALPEALVNLGGPGAANDDGDTRLESAANQLAGLAHADRVVLTAGKFGITDVFDANSYSHDSRRQFLTWASLAHGSYDFAADAKGYTWGAALEAYHHSGWAVRAGRFVAPEQPNGQQLNRAIGRYYGDQVELEKRFTLAPALVSLQGAEPLPGVVRVLLWRNREVMGRFADALNESTATGQTPPTLDQVRRPNQKRGIGLHIEQKLLADVGGFVRYQLGRRQDRGLLVRGSRPQRADRPVDQRPALASARRRAGPFGRAEPAFGRAPRFPIGWRAWLFRW